MAVGSVIPEVTGIAIHRNETGMSAPAHPPFPSHIPSCSVWSMLPNDNFLITMCPGGLANYILARVSKKKHWNAAWCIIRFPLPLPKHPSLSPCRRWTWISTVDLTINSYHYHSGPVPRSRPLTFLGSPSGIILFPDPASKLLTIGIFQNIRRFKFQDKVQLALHNDSGKRNNMAHSNNR